MTIKTKYNAYYVYSIVFNINFSNSDSLQRTYFVVEKLRTELTPLHVKLISIKKKRMSIAYLL
jgi:hypothetical protein